MRARSHPCADAGAHIPRSPQVRAPIPPAEPVKGVSGPTYVAHDGHVWRRAMGFWSHLDGITADRLLVAFRVDEMNSSDWFHARAGVLADELETAISQARTLHEEAA